MSRWLTATTSCSGGRNPSSCRWKVSMRTEFRPCEKVHSNRRVVVHHWINFFAEQSSLTNEFHMTNPTDHHSMIDMGMPAICTALTWFLYWTHFLILNDTNRFCNFVFEIRNFIRPVRWRFDVSGGLHPRKQSIKN